MSRKSRLDWKLTSSVIGVYRIYYMPNGAEYIGSSKRCIANRLSWHLCRLRAGTHSSKTFQEEWNDTVEEDWNFEVLEICAPEEVRFWERYWQSLSVISLTEEDKPRSFESKMKSSASRHRYFDTPGAREILSENAKKQHAERRFGY